MSLTMKTSAALAFAITILGPVAARAADPIPAGYVLMETIPVPPDGSTVNSTTVLSRGTTYWLRVSGSDPGAGDAEYDPSGHDTCTVGSGQTDVGVSVEAGLLDLAPTAALVFKGPFWGVFDPSHVYTSQVTGTGRTLSVAYRDCNYGDNAGGLTLQIYALGGVRCEIFFTQHDYVEGDRPPTVDWIRVNNTTPAPATVEVKLWLRTPGRPPIPIVNVGSDYSVQLPGNREFVNRDIVLFTVGPTTPRGTYELGCVLMDPVTAEVHSEAIDYFDVR